MIFLGFSLEFKGIKEHLSDAAFKYGTAGDFTSFSILMVSIFCVTGLEWTVTIMEAAMPSAMLSVMLAITYDLEIKLTPHVYYSYNSEFNHFTTCFEYSMNFIIIQ